MKRLLLILVFIFSHSAQAAEWIPVRIDPNSDQYYYDRSKLYMSGDEITYWKRIVFRTPQPAKNQYAVSGLYRERINCAEHTIKTIRYLLYANDGNVIDDGQEGEVSPIIPDTLGDLFERKICPIIWQKQEEQRIKRAEEERKKAEEAAKKPPVPLDPKNTPPLSVPDKSVAETPAEPAAVPTKTAPAP